MGKCLQERDRWVLEREVGNGTFANVFEDIPKLIETALDRDPPYIVMELLGSTLEQLRQEFVFTSKTIAMIGVQLISAFEAVHAAGVVHRDVKPDNLAVSLNRKDQKIYIFDFGSATKYLINGIHVNYREDTGYSGNLIFCSQHAMQRVRSSRRDDMESLGYVLLYLYDASLPWSQIYSNDYRVRCEQEQVKTDIKPSTLSSTVAQEFIDYIDYCRNLGFEERPNYDYLRNLLMSAALRFGFDGFWDYDWLKKSVHHSTPTETLHVPSSIYPQKHSSGHKKHVIVQKMRDIDSITSSPGQLLRSLKHDNTFPSATPTLGVPSLTSETAATFASFTEGCLSVENCSEPKRKILEIPELSTRDTQPGPLADTPKAANSGIVNMTRLKLKAIESSARKVSN